MIIRAILIAFCVTAAIFASAGSAAHGPTEIGSSHPYPRTFGSFDSCV